MKILKGLWGFVDQNCCISGQIAPNIHKILMIICRHVIWMKMDQVITQLICILQYVRIGSFHGFIFRGLARWYLDNHQIKRWNHGPLTRYITLLVAHAPGMLELFSPTPTPNEAVCWLRMRLACWNCFPRHRIQMKPLVSDPGMHRGTCGTHVYDSQWGTPFVLTKGLFFMFISRVVNQRGN